MSTSRAAVYGRSCLECTQAKLRCNYRGEGASRCDRCVRQGRECAQPQRKRTLRGDGRTPRRLFGGAVSEVSATEREPERPSPSTPVSLPDPISSTEPFPTPIASDFARSRSPWLTVLNTKLVTLGVDDVRANEYLSTFRTAHAVYFPFVHIDPSLNAFHFQSHRPYLFLAIMATGPTAIPQQLQLAELLRSEVAQATVVESRKSLDLLLAILTYMQW
ncbi:hypothetical protein ANO11243_080770 [Dothideomycetidae sp. 11243]|nr:hypothetical protein ANO11243_080770 [fungal sp. No.11243]